MSVEEDGEACDRIAASFERMAATMTAQSIRIDELIDFVRAFHHLCTVYPDLVSLMVKPGSDMLRRAEELIKQGVAK